MMYIGNEKAWIHNNLLWIFLNNCKLLRARYTRDIRYSYYPFIFYIMMWTWSYGYMPFIGGNIFGFLLMIVFWICIMWIVIWIMRSGLNRGTYNSFKDRSGIKILEERYAKWEIDKKEFEEKMQDIKQHQS